MPRARTWTDDDGSASLEFLTVGVLLLVPIAYLVIALGAIQNASLGVEASARFVARSIAGGQDAPPDAVLASVADAYGLDPDALEVRVTCLPEGPECPTAGSTVSVTVADRVPLPLVPGFLGLGERLAVPVDATAVFRASRLAETSP